MSSQTEEYSENQSSDDYESLPDSIKMNYTRKEYLWLSDGEKARLIQTETEPEC